MGRTAELEDDLAWEHLKDLAAQQAEADDDDPDRLRHDTTYIDQLGRQ